MKKNLAVILGGQRSGSTLLATALGQHPEITLNYPIRPEPKFFLKNNASQYCYNKYIEKYFSHIDESTKVILEKSTSYIESPMVIKRVLDLFPAAKFLIILRNPYDRLLSNYKFSVDNKIETRTLEDIFIHNVPPPALNNEVSVSPFDYVKRSQYPTLLKPIIETKCDFRIIFFEKFIQNIEGELTKIYQYLGVKDINGSNKIRVVNKSQVRINVSTSLEKTIKGHLENTILGTEKLLNVDLSFWKS